MEGKKEVFAVFEICSGSYDDIYKLSCIYSTLEKALDAIKEASLRKLSSSLKFYIKEVESSVSDPLDDYSFCYSYENLRDLDSEKVKDFLRSYVWISCRLDEEIEFEIGNGKYFEGPFELSTEQRDEIQSVVQNKVYLGRFEQIQQKKFEEKSYPNLRKFRKSQM